MSVNTLPANTLPANSDFQRVNEWGSLRGFSNLVRKENRAWWGTRRWWIQALLWTVLLCGLTGIMLFGPNEELQEASAAEIAQIGGEMAYILSVGLSVFFEFGLPVLAIGIIVLTQGSILSEKQNGVAEWLLAKPVTRRAYLLAKLAGHVVPVLILMIGLPATVTYGLMSYRVGGPFSVGPYLAAVGMMVLHSLFYLTFTLLLGTVFDNRGPILGITIGSVLGGGALGGLINPLFYITPWMLPKLAMLTASGQGIPGEVGLAPVLATALWCVLFVLIAFTQFEKMEF
jgi:ABC-2 type transport system permease protein